MAEVFNFDFYQIPHTGVKEPDLIDQVRFDPHTTTRRALDMKVSTWEDPKVGNRMPASQDYTRVNLGFKDKGESEDINVITADTGRGSNVQLRSVTVVLNPHVKGSSIKYTRDDQFIRMTMSKDTGTELEATQVDPPMFDVMDTNVATAEGIMAAENHELKNWPSEGWRSYGGKYDFEPYMGGHLK